MINYMTGIMNHLGVKENELFDLLDLDKNLMHQNFRLNQYGLIDDCNMNNATELRRLITGQYIIKHYKKGDNMEIPESLISKVVTKKFSTVKDFFQVGNKISLFYNRHKFLVKEVGVDLIIVEIL